MALSTRAFVGGLSPGDSGSVFGSAVYRVGRLEPNMTRGDPHTTTTTSPGDASRRQVPTVFPCPVGVFDSATTPRAWIRGAIHQPICCAMAPLRRGIPFLDTGMENAPPNRNHYPETPGRRQKWHVAMVTGNGKDCPLGVGDHSHTCPFIVLGASWAPSHTTRPTS